MGQRGERGRGPCLFLAWLGRGCLLPLSPSQASFPFACRGIMNHLPRSLMSPRETRRGASSEVLLLSASLRTAQDPVLTGKRAAVDLKGVSAVPPSKVAPPPPKAFLHLSQSKTQLWGCFRFPKGKNKQTKTGAGRLLAVILWF